jgi:hypothetical protein
VYIETQTYTRLIKKEIKWSEGRVWEGTKTCIETEVGTNIHLSGLGSTEGRGFGLVVRAAAWHAGDQGSILGRDGLYRFQIWMNTPNAVSILGMEMCGI